jgi:hypothetical protein
MDWEADAQQLHQLARELYSQTPQVEVRISRQLADKAVAAWQRDDGEGDLPDESPDQRAVRHEAATFSLIGLSIENTGIEDGDQVVFKLDAWLLGNALEAADRAGRLDGLNPPRQ